MELDEPMPPWAIDIARGEWPPAVGSQMSTKDGRRIGNACLVRYDRTAGLLGLLTIGVLITDTGQEVRMTPDEMAAAFHPPKWIMNPLTCPGRLKK